MSRGPAPWKSSDVAWSGGRRPYDLIKEVIISGCIVAVLVVGLTILFASPDPPPATMAQWAKQAPQDFAATTLQEIAGTSLSATYGPPYQTTSQDGSTQGYGPISPEKWFGQGIPINSFQDYVAGPLSTVPGNPAAKAVAQWQNASAGQQQVWASAYTDALKQSSFTGGTYDVPSGDYGPVGSLVRAQYALARSGGLDAAFLGRNPNRISTWYTNDQTLPLMYLGDSGQGGSGPDCISAVPVAVNRKDPTQQLPAGYGCFYYNLSVANSAPQYAGYLAGNTWGIMNEVGNWPGAWWLPLYTVWYQFGPGLNGSNADLFAMIMTGIFAMLFLLIPWIPGVRSIPKLTRVYRLMWSDYYALTERRRTPPPTPKPPDT